MNSWFTHWFNEDYLNLYADRDQQEAERQAEFLVNALGLKGTERILDLGCGTGRHTLAFAKRGFLVVGVDLSPTLIQVGEKALLGYENAALVRSDMFNVKGLGRFDLVINMFTSFGYFDDDEKNARIFDVAKKHLVPGGRFFMDFLHPQEVRRDLIPYEETSVKGEIVKIRKWIAGDQVCKSISFPGREYLEKIKLYTRSQIEEMARANGFTVLKVWNDYSGAPWKAEGDRQLFCFKLASP